MLKIISLASCAIFALGVTAFAQDRVTETPRETRQENRQERREERKERQLQNQTDRVEHRALKPDHDARSTHSMIDEAIASCLILKNQEEIELAQFAAERSQNAEVRNFAQMLIQDHQQLVQKLQPFAKHEITLQGSTKDRANVAAQAGADRRDGQPTSERNVTLDRDARSAHSGDHADDIHRQMFQIAQAEAQECLRLAKNELTKFQGDKFDQAFLGQQIAAHLAMNAKLKAPEGHVSNSLEQVLQQARQSTEQHQRTAEQLMNTLKQDRVSNR